MPEGLNVNKEGEKMTPQKMMEEIQKVYPTSHAFVEEIIKAGDANWGMKFDNYDAQDVVVKLAQLHRSIVIHHEYTYNIEGQEEKEKKMYERGLWLGGMAVAVYYGELTMIGKDGKLLSKPEPFQKN